MPIDPLFLLAPLTALPIVLLFAFIGCPVPDVWFGSVALQWGFGFDSDIDSIEVTFRLQPTSGESPSNLIVNGTLTGADLASFFAGTLFDKSQSAPWVAGGDGDLSCTCTLIQKATSKTVLVTASQHFGASDSDTHNFELARIGAGFDQASFPLSVLDD